MYLFSLIIYSANASQSLTNFDAPIHHLRLFYQLGDSQDPDSYKGRFKDYSWIKLH